MGLLKGIFNLADNIVSIPTDMLGITNNHGKNKARKIARTALAYGKINRDEYEELLAWIELQ